MKIHVEVFIASKILEKRQSTFSPNEVIEFIRTEFGDERSGIRTHATAACVANAPVNHPNCYNYLWRIDHAEYRTYHPGRDPLKPEKKGFRHQPYPIDVPEKYRYLLRVG